MDWNQLWLGLGLAIPATVIGILAHRRSQKVDAASAQSGAASNHRAGTQQVIEGLNSLLDQAQETIIDDREVIKLLEGRMATFSANLDACQAENRRLRQKYEPNA